MSRIGKRTLTIPDKVEVGFQNGVVSVKGPLGELQVPVRPEIDVKVSDGNIETLLVVENKETPMLWGLYNSLIFNALEGVTKGYEKKLELVGVGYRVKKTDKGISMTLGFSHPVEYNPPVGIDITVEDQSNMAIKGFDKALVGQVAAKIRSFKKPEPYKGKGIKYKTEVVRRKAGKAGKGAK